MKNKREAEFTTKLKKYLVKHPDILGQGGFALEVKVTADRSIAFDEVKEHQLWALLTVTNSTFIYKIPDAGWQNPFDMVYMRQADAYIVMAFIKPRNTGFYFITPGEFVEMTRDADKSSVTDEELEEWGFERHTF